MEGLHAIFDLHLQRWEQQYPPTIQAHTPTSRLAFILEQAHRQTGKRTCVIIYDVPRPQVFPRRVTGDFHASPGGTSVG